MRVAIADDAVIVRAGLDRLLSAAGIEVCATASDLPSLLREVAIVRPDAAVVDLRMPPAYADEGLQAARLLARDRPEVAVVLLSQYAEPRYAAAMLSTAPGGRGYLLKDSVLDAGVLVDALPRVVAGGTVVDPALVATAVTAPGPAGRLDVLSSRERTVLQLLAEGLTDRGIAERLEVSPRTVATHVQHVFTKLDLPDGPRDNRRVLAVLAFLDR